MKKPETKSLIYWKERLTETNPEEVLFLIKNPQFDRKPCLSFKEFVDNPYYLGIGEDVWQKIKEEGEIIWNLYQEGKISEAVLLWGIGSGKSFLSSVIALLFVHWLLCLENPHKYFKMTNDKPIAVVNMGTTAIQAKNVIFVGLRKLIEGSPFFQEYNPEILQTEIRFNKKNIALYCGNSQETMPIGLNVLMGILDEAAWYLDNEEKSIAEDIYNLMRNRITSRFGNKGFLMIISAPRYVDDFISRHFEKSKNLDFVYTSRYKTWEVKDRSKMSAEAFDFIVEVDKEGNPVEIWQGIPIDFKRAAESNPEKFMRDFGAKPSLVLESYDRDADIIERNISNRESPVHSDGQLKDWFKCEDKEPRFIHIDLGLKKDACGFAMGKLDGWDIIEGERRPKVFIDLVLQIKAKPNEEIIFSEVRQLIYSLQDRGFNIQKVTFDGWQCLTERVKVPIIRTMKENTKIPLLKGLEVSIKDIKKDDYVFSLNKKQEIVTGRVLSDAKMAGKKRIYEVILDNQEVIECSGNHPFMLRDGTYKRADELKGGDSLMPLYFKDGMKNLKEYKMVYNPRYNKFEYIHRVVARQINVLRKNKVVHHKDGNKNNNEPENLISLTQNKHMRLHKEIGKRTIIIAREKLRNNLEALKRKNKAFLENAKKYRETATFEQRSIAGKKSWETRQRKGIKLNLLDWIKNNKQFYREFMKEEWKKNQAERKNKISKTIKLLWQNPEYRKKNLLARNHKVIDVIKTNRYEKTYDIEVEDFHNFAISSGIFVHNSVDSIQILRERGINAEVLSVDKDTKAYDTLKEMLHTKRFDCYFYEPLIKEYKKLELIKGKKVDHPPGGSKDVSDAVAGVCYNVAKYAEEFTGLKFQWL